jgi:hypothetical protein
MSDDTEDMSVYKRKNSVEIDRLFRANNIIAPQVAGTDAYRRGHIWNFEWCSEDPKKAKPDLVEAVKYRMDHQGMTFEDAFNEVYERYGAKTP